jgi:pimeloyl-[acyl-carrier protein] methyl ester esterase
MSEGFKIISRGRGPELVLVHGWAMHSGIWGGVIDALVTEFRVNLVDLPGHGINRHVALSRDLDAVATLILSELPTAAWLGWSLGGLVTLAAALKQPEKVEKLVLVGATPSFSRTENWEWGLGEAARQAFSDGLEQAFEQTVEHFALQTFGASHLQESLGRLGDLPLTENLPAKNTLHDGLHLLYSNNLLVDLKKCKMPTLFLGGTRDRTIRPKSFEQAASLMPDARVASIPGAGHAPFISHEEEFLQHIRGFLREDHSS